MITIRETESFKTWIRALKDRQTKQIINAHIRRLSTGNWSDSKPVGEGVSELRIGYGPGYRVYFIRRGKEIVILLCGGGKSTQSRDIDAAKEIAANLEGGYSMKPVKTTIWDPVEYLETEEDIALYLEEVFKIGDPDLIVTAVGDVARARGMSKIAGETNRGRESLYKSLSPEGNPSFETIMKVLSSLGFGLRPAPVS